MRVTILLAGLGVAVIPKASANAQSRLSPPTQTGQPRSAFSLPTNSDLSRLLDGRLLESSTVPPLPAIPRIELKPTLGDSTTIARQTCPMPVADPYKSKASVQRMPVVIPDSSSQGSMPVLRPSCVNPLRG
jgi:hypothetical protein